MPAGTSNNSMAYTADPAETSGKIQRLEGNRVRIICSSLILVFILMGLFYAVYGRIFLDAGFYLDAARRVMQGEMPYRDFFYVQGPVYPYVYGLPLQWLGLNVFHARLLSLFWGVLALLLAARTAYRNGGGTTGAVIALAALATVPAHAYFFTAVKLYALAGFFLMAAFDVLSRPRPGTARYAAAAVLAILAAATRLTLVPAAVLLILTVIVHSVKYRRTIPWTALVAAGVSAAALSLPFLIADREAVLYNLIGIHTSAASGPYLFSFAKQIRVLAKLVVFYPLLSIGFAGIVIAVFKGRLRWKQFGLMDGAMLAVIGTVTAAHLSANWFSMGYQSVLMPLTAAWIGGLLGRSMGFRGIGRTSLVLAAAAALVAGAAGWRQHVWRFDVSAMRSLAFIGEVIEKQVPPSRTVAACNAVFALQAHRRPTGAFGGAPFTYTPRWDDATCRRYGGMNNRMIIDLIQRREPGALLFESDSFAVGFPGFYPVPQETQDAIFDAVGMHYQETARLRNLGGGEMRLIMYTPQSVETLP